MLSDLLSLKDIQFSDELLGWEDAISLSAQPLLESQKISPSYITAMIDKVKEFGPFINLGQGVALPHARPEEGVKDFGMAVLRLKQPTHLLGDSEQAVSLLFCLAASDSTKHLQALSSLTKLLSNKLILERLFSAKTSEEFMEVIKEGEQS